MKNLRFDVYSGVSQTAKNLNMWTVNLKGSYLKPSNVRNFKFQVKKKNRHDTQTIARIHMTKYILIYPCHSLTLNGFFISTPPDGLYRVRNPVHQKPQCHLYKITGYDSVFSQVPNQLQQAIVWSTTDTVQDLLHLFRTSASGDQQILQDTKKLVPGEASACFTFLLHLKVKVIDFHRPSRPRRLWATSRLRNMVVIRLKVQVVEKGKLCCMRHHGSIRLVSQIHPLQPHHKLFTFVPSCLILRPSRGLMLPMKTLDHVLITHGQNAKYLTCKAVKMENHTDKSLEP